MSSIDQSGRPCKRSERLLERLTREEELLQVKQEDLRKLPALIRLREKAYRQMLEAIDTQTRSEADRDRLKRNHKAKLVDEAINRKRQLPDEIKEVKKIVQSLESQLDEAKALEKKFEAAVS